MIIYSQKPEEQYYEAIAGERPSLVVFGEVGEQWTAAVLDFFEKRQLPVFFFPWGKIPEIRLQLGVTKYPVTQLWHKDECVQEVVGYEDEALDGLARTFFHKGRSK